jgi:hypothetical protein
MGSKKELFIPDAIRIAKGTKKLMANTITCYLNFFGRKHGLEFEYWPGNDIGGVAAYGDYFFNFSDILFDIDTEQPIGQIIEWHNACVDYHCIEKPSETQFINYRSWCMGARFKAKGE